MKTVDTSNLSLWHCRDIMSEIDGATMIAGPTQVSVVAAIASVLVEVL